MNVKATEKLAKDVGRAGKQAERRATLELAKKGKAAQKGKSPKGKASKGRNRFANPGIVFPHWCV